MSDTTSIPVSSLGEPFYTGSVQQLFDVPGNDAVMVTQTTNRGSVFDVGALFEIPGNDVNRAVFRHVLYTKLGDPEVWKKVADAIQNDPELPAADKEDLLRGPLEKCLERGAKTHHEGMIDAETGEVSRDGVPAHPSAYNVVRKFQILKPTRTELLGAHLFDYSQFPQEDGFVVPLEYIVRFGITSGSSVYRKYLAMSDAAKKSFETELGVSRSLEAWQLLERPITDFTSKFEPEDRMVSKQEAVAMCGLSGDLFVDSGKMGVLGAWVVRHLLDEIGLLLWDIKWEFAIDGDELVFVDTIDTDSFRATRFLDVSGEGDADGRYVMHFNKQSMRDYFKILHSDWIAGIDEAKKRAETEGVAFTELLAAGQADGTYPQTPVVADEFLAIQVKKMELIRDYMIGTAEAEAVSAALQQAGEDEVGFYRDKGKFAEFAKLNKIG
jgi:phosphoribosylaminoimidazole-succinocarboxamide synthase